MRWHIEVSRGGVNLNHLSRAALLLHPGLREEVRDYECAGVPAAVIPATSLAVHVREKLEQGGIDQCLF